MNQDKLYHMYTSPWTVMYVMFMNHVIKFTPHVHQSPWTEVVMHEPGQTLSHVHLTMNWSSNAWTHVHLTMNWSSNAWTRTNFITCTPWTEVVMHEHMYTSHELKCTCMNHGQHYTFSSWTEVYMWYKFVLTMNWSSNAWTRTNVITCTPHHELK